MLGYNNNVRHKNRVFHIQTEDSGVNHPHIITHLFMDGGRILKSVKKSYAEHVGADGMSETVRVLMKEQHKAMFIALRDGQFDHLVDGGAPARAPAPSSPEIPPAAPSAPEVAAAPAAPAAPVHPSGQLAPATQPDPPVAPKNEAPKNEERKEPFIAVTNEPEEVPTTTREQRPKAPGHELTLDFDALERAAHDVAAPSLFNSTDLPPPPKNLFAKEPGTGGKYQALEPTRDSSPPSSRTPRRDPREEPAPHSKPPPSRPATKSSPASSKGSSGRTPSGRPGERYAPARPAAIFGSTQKPPTPQSQSIFGDELISDKSLDEVILSYLAEDLEPPRRK
ncbi:MAG: hypothetical protein KF819_27455 [Labilithrix sp.]|nr:hypothetical protein [Labilithrix sp.]